MQRRKRNISFYSREEMMESNTEEETEFFLDETVIPYEQSPQVYKSYYLSEEKSEEEDEKTLQSQIKQMNQCYSINNSLINTKNKDCKELVCSCLKETLYEGKSILKPTRSLSHNSLHDIKFKDLIDSFLKESQYYRTSLESNFSSSTTGSTKDSIRDILFQNLASQDDLKLLIASNSTLIKNQCLTNFINEDIPDNFQCKGIEIRKKKLEIDDKIIETTIFDAGTHFFQDTSSQIYYKIVNAIILIIDSSLSGNHIEFIKEVYNQKMMLSIDLSMIIIDIRKLVQPFGEDPIKRFCIKNNITFICFGSVFDFEIKNKRIKNFLKLLLIKKRSNFRIYDKRNIEEKDTEEYDNDDDEQDLLNFDANYSINDNTESIEKYDKNHRKWSLENELLNGSFSFCTSS